MFRTFDLRLTLTLGLLALGGCSATAPNATADKGLTAPAVSTADPHTQCLTASPGVTSHSPMELYLSAGHCLTQNRLDDAMFLFGTAGSQGRFDTQRVPDKTAHQLANFMPIFFMKHVGEAPYARFSAHMREQLQDDKARQAFCERLKQLPPPSHDPQYMINHGMAAFTAQNGAPALTPLPNPEQAWHWSVEGYMDCGKA